MNRINAHHANACCIFEYWSIGLVFSYVVFFCVCGRLVVDNCSCKPVQWVGRQEFVVPSNVLGLVYGQTVVWVGALFCPLLPAINTLKFVILFYCKKVRL